MRRICGGIRGVFVEACKGTLGYVRRYTQIVVGFFVVAVVLKQLYFVVAVVLMLCTCVDEALMYPCFMIFVTF